MTDSINGREYGWIESSDSEISAELFADEVESVSRSSENDEVPFARHGPKMEADPEDLANQRGFWNFCAIGFISDYRKFSISHLQHILNAAWRLRGSVTIVGRDSNFYLLHFNLIEDLNDMCNDSPWAVDVALFVLERWRSNLVLDRLHLNFVSLWVQLHGLPLEYQYPELAERL